jgi:uncharacterized protein (TIGR00299 family) protein
VSIVYFDLVGGASGDMILGSLVAAGAPLEEIDRRLRALPLEGFSLSRGSALRHGFEAFQLKVEARETKSHRHFSEIRRLLSDAKLPERVYRRALGTFERLGKAEAEAHQVPLEKVHFHEVGAIDAIVDVVGTAWALELLDVERCHASVVPQGRGLVRAAHGTLPVPAPATLRLLEGFPVRMLEIEGELTTPTGAALITSLCDTVGAPVGMRLVKTGVATGTKDFPERPNVVRALVGEPLDTVGSGEVDVIECTIDDMNPQLYGHLTEALFESGAVEVYLTAVQMKKGRPGVLVTAMADPRRSAQVAERLFGESTTLGLRIRREGRMELRRSISEVETPLGKVRVKTAILPSGEERRVPEYEDLRRIAREGGRPLVEVMETVRAYLGEGARAPT